MTVREIYEAYLQGDHWSHLKTEKAKVEKRECLSCTSTANIQLHHMKYRNPLESAELDDLCWLCGDCHLAFHQKVGMQFDDVQYNLLRAATVRAILTPGKPFLARTKTKAQRKKAVKVKRVQLKHVAAPASGWLKLSKADQDKQKSPNGGFTNDTLASWGVAWPAKKGWRRKLAEGRNPNA